MFLITAAQAAETASEAASGAIEPTGFANPETWIAITWLIVVALLARPVYRGITKGLDARALKIKDRLAEAERLRDEAQTLLSTYQKKQREALKEAENIIAQAKAEAERLAKQAALDLDELVKRREQQALDRINQAEAEAMREVRNKAVEIAIAATGKLIAETLPADKANELIDAAIKDLPNRLH
jgi:F-type H+-transporting ATPase subunit b